MADIIFHQFHLFLLSAAYGMLLGAWYDFFRALRKKMTHKNRTVHMEDVIFCLTSAAGLFLLFQIYNQGAVRFYCLVGIWLGALGYFALFSRIVGRFFCLAVSAAAFFFKTAERLLLFPEKIIVKNIVKVLKNVIKTIKIIKNCK